MVNPESNGNSKKRKSLHSTRVQIREPERSIQTFVVLTTTALETSPFLTPPPGIAALTETTIKSPTEAYLFLLPPKTLMQRTLLAPELSATIKFVSC